MTFQVEFEELGHTGPDHFRTYNIRAVIGDMACDSGMGRSKKDAKRQAAAIALKSLGYQVSSGECDTSRLSLPATGWCFEQVHGTCTWLTVLLSSLSRDVGSLEVPVHLYAFPSPPQNH